MRKDYNDWLDSPEAQRSNHGLYGYLEKENSEVPEANKLENAQKALQAGWTELAQRNMAPDTWGKASTSTWQFIHSTMEKGFSFFKLTEDGWKLDYLCMHLYPSWCSSCLDADGNLKKNARNTVKEEASNEDKDLSKTASPSLRSGRGTRILYGHRARNKKVSYSI